MESTDSLPSHSDAATAPDALDSLDDLPLPPEKSQSPPQAIDSPHNHSPTDLKEDLHLHLHDSNPETSLSLPLQKRRRVTRACDECRRKKIKCDGKQPCPHCLVYSYECTYDKPSNRRRNPTPQYISVIERKLKRAELLLRLISPDLDLNDPHIDESLEDGADSIESVLKDLSIKPKASSETHRHTPSASVCSPPFGRSTAAANPSSSSQDHTSTDRLESMLKTTGQFDLDENGRYDFYGGSSGLIFARKMRERLSNLIGKDKSTLLQRPYHSGSSFVWESVLSADSPSETSAVDLELPPPDVARFLCDLAMDDASSLLRTIHLPTFQAGFDRLYSRSPSEYSNEDHTFLPLFYSLLALACLYARDENSELDSKGYSAAIDNGFKYYKAATRLIDVTDCRDLNTLQALVYLIQFLQSSARLSTCYSYVGCAMRSALRMGLHRKLEYDFNPVELEIRKRVFWVIRRMDVHISTVLGLPHSLNDEDIDQDLPAIVDDEYITSTGILPMPPGSYSLMAASDAHIRLLPILMKAVKCIYPVRPLENSGSFTVPASLIRELEVDLQKWNESLPMHLRPGGDYPTNIIRAQQLLRLSYAHIQMMIYRPFLHYISRSDTGLTPNKLSYAYAATCISVSRNIVHIVTEMYRQHLLIGAHWFTMYTAFFAVLSLLFYVLENPEDDTTLHVLRDAYEGKATLAQLAKRSLAADRCTAILKALFCRLPEHLVRKYQNQHTSFAAKKKRSIELCNSAPPGVLDKDRTHNSASLNEPQSQSSQAPSQTVEFDHTNCLSQSALTGSSLYVPNGDDLEKLLDESISSSQTAFTNQFSDLRSYLQGPALVFPDGDPFAYPQQTLNPFDPEELDLIGFPDFMNDFNASSATDQFSSTFDGLASSAEDIYPLGTQSGVSISTSQPPTNNNHSILGVDEGLFNSVNFSSGEKTSPLFSKPTTNTTGFSMPVSLSQPGQPLPTVNQDLHVPVPAPMPSYMLAPNTLFLSQKGGNSVDFHTPVNGEGSTTSHSGLTIQSALNPSSHSANQLSASGSVSKANQAATSNFGLDPIAASSCAEMGTSDSTSSAPPFETSTPTFLEQHQPQQLQQVSDPGMWLQEKMLRSLQFDPLSYCPSTSGIFPSQSPALNARSTAASPTVS